MKMRSLSMALAVSLALSSTLAMAANQTWQGDTSSDWQTGGNWSGGALPGNPDTALFDNTATTTTPTISASANVGTIDLSGSTGFTFGATAGVTYLRGATALTSTSSANQSFGGFNYRGYRTGDSTFSNTGTGLIDFNVPIYKEDTAGSSSTNAGNLIFNGTGNFEVERVGKRYGNLQSGLTKSGTGTLTIVGAMTSWATSGTSGPEGLTNTVTISSGGGTLKIKHPQALGTGNISINKNGSNTGTLELALTGTNTISNTFNGFASSYVLGSGGTANILNTSGTNTITSDLTVTTTGGNGMNFVSNGGLLELAGTLTTTVDSNREVDLGGTGNGLVSGDIIDTSGKQFSVRKADSGTWTLTGTNTYSKSTFVKGGTLLVNGTNSGGGSYSVDSGATLGGTGAITASTMNITGAMAPGASIESLQVTATTVTFDSASTLKIEINDSDSNVVDLLAITGDLTITSGATVDFSVTGLLSQSQYIFGTYTGSLSGLFNSTTIPSGYQLEQGGGQLKLTLIPEPSALVLMLVGIMGLGYYRCRR